MWFTRVSINHPVFATMMMVAFLVLGVFSYSKLSVEQFPDVTFPVVVISTEYPGASPEIVESEVTRRVEEQVNTISGVNQLSSRSYEGSSIVIVQFDLTIDPTKAAQDVREKIALVKPVFKKEVKESLVTRINPDDQAIISISLRSETRPARQLTTLADQVVKRRLENARGVGRVTVIGGVKREIQIYLKPQELEALKIGVDQVLNAVRSDNQELPAGTLVSKDREQAVQIKARLKAATDFEKIIVARRGGQPVYLAQVASVIDGEEEQENVALVNGTRAVSLDIVKAQGENTIGVVDGVRKIVEQLQTQLPSDVKIVVVRDASTSIRNSVKSVQRNIVEGAALTILIVFLFLASWRSTVITGLTLPISLIGTFVAMYAMGFSINLITLLALSICVGLLIDDAIVVRENIVRHQAMGKHHKIASFDGTKEIGLAVAATTFTIVAVFLPIGFMGGIIGRFFKQFGVTVAFAVMLSMFVSFTLDPMLSSVWKDPAANRVPGTPSKNPINWLLDAFHYLMAWLERSYVAMLGWGLKHRWLTLTIALLSMVAAIAMSGKLGKEFVPQADNNEFYLQFYTPVGSSLELTQTKVKQVEAAMRDMPGVEFTYATINTGVVQGKNYATVFSRLVSRNQRQLSVQQMRAPVRARMAQIPGITITDAGTLSSVGSGKPVQVSVQGPDLAVLEKIAEQAKQVIQRQAGVVDLDTSSKPAKPTISVNINRELASDLGVSVGQISAAMRPLLAGESASTWRGPDDENYDVKVRLPRTERNTIGDLERLAIVSNLVEPDGTPRMIALRQVAQFTQGVGPTQVNRKDLTREILISANVDGAASGSVGEAVKREVEAIPLPPGYRFATGGATKDMIESLGFAAQALALGIIFIYMILASQFGSFTQPIAIMMALPLSLIGVVMALVAWKSTVNMFSVIGFIMLMGLVTKNAILLVDFANQARAQGTKRAAALLKAAEIRLRPILMTTLAMVFGMIPLAIGLGEGSEQRAPLAHAVIGGVIASTLLTLLVVPVLYTLLDDLVNLVLGKKADIEELPSSSSLDAQHR
jgi:hydrophobic/amphiphilic exporter-1 (mainly G- bacteria), HAE1 family